MAWAALIPVAAQMLGSLTEKKEEAPQPAMPPAPSLGETFAANSAKYSGPTQFSSLNQSNPFSPFPTGSGSRGSNG